jgi:NAD(P)-dependent dehydrogenase (short-subunit alcohol dehydrogenase family)
VARAAEHFGRLDVIVNNAGYGHFGMVEELSDDDIRQQLETNLLGTLWVAQAHHPSDQRGRSDRVTGDRAYHASKWAVEGLSQSLAQEVATHGIRVTLVEPGPYNTDWLAVGARKSQKNPAYDSVRNR